MVLGYMWLKGVLGFNNQEKGVLTLNSLRNTALRQKGLKSPALNTLLLCLSLYGCRITKPLTFADCVGDELPLGWEVMYDQQVGVYYIDHINSEYNTPLFTRDGCLSPLNRYGTIIHTWESIPYLFRYRFRYFFKDYFTHHNR